MSEVLKRRMRCAVYTRKSSEEGLDQEYNSIDAQRDAGHAYIASQRAEGWIAVADDYDDPAFSVGNMERPALKRLMTDIEAGKIDVIVIYKIDRLTRSLPTFPRWSKSLSGKACPLSRSPSNSTLPRPWAD
jgi:site-specific DNA recombinase